MIEEKIVSELRSFNATGMDRFEKHLADFDAEIWLDPFDDAFSEPLKTTSPLQVEDFHSARHMAKNILNALGSETMVISHLDDIGLWSWLTFLLRTQLFKKNKDNTLKLGEHHRWYPSPAGHWQKGQRHLVRMPVFLLARLGPNADHLLCGNPKLLPEIREQMTGQQDMITDQFQAVARRLYYDEKRGALKTGTGGKGGGSPRRLRTLRTQLTVTWQLEDLSIDELIKKLPKEFDRFKT